MSHISYIGMRPGVDLGTEKRLNQSALQDEFEIDDEEEQYISPDTAAGHVKYADERPRSHGLFSSDSVTSVKAVQQELRHHKGLVWRGILSLNESDAIRLGYEEREAWKDMLRTTVPLMANEMGIPESNLRWVAAFHQEKGHPHVHLVVWEKVPKRSRGLLSEPETRAIKKTFMNEIYGEERIRLSQEKTAERDLIRQIAKEDLVKSVELIREVRAEQKQVELEMKAAGAVKSVGIAPKLYKETNKELADQLSELSAIMPKKGRLNYKFMPDDVKAKIDEISAWVLNQPSQKNHLNNYLNTVEFMTRQYTFQPEQIQAAKDKAYADIQKRVSQIVLKAASESQKNNFLSVIPEKAQIVIEQFSQAIGAPEDVSKSVVLNSAQHLRLLGFSKEEQTSIFNSWLKQADLRLNAIEINQILESEYNRPAIEIDLNHQAVSSILKFSGWSDTEISDVLMTKAGISSDEASAYVALATNDFSQTKELFISESDWSRFNRNMGMNESYPWNVEEISITIPEAKNDFIYSLEKAVFNPDMTEQERGWTAFCMTVALKGMDVSHHDRRVIMSKFASRNHVPGLERILNTIENDQTTFIKKPTWEKITQDLGLTVNYPWITKEVITLNQKKLEESVQNIEHAVPKQVDKEEASWTVDQFVQILKTVHTETEQVDAIVKQWNTKNKLLDDKELPLSHTEKHRTEDLEVLRKSFDIKDVQHETVSSFAKVLFAAGLNTEEVNKMIKDWNIRSNANIPEQKINKILASADKYCTEMQSWGRVPFIRKNDFKNLCKTLGVDAPWMWKGDREYRRFERSVSMDMAQGMWKAIWKGVEQERAQTEAKGEILKQQLVREQVRRQQQSQEEER